MKLGATRVVRKHWRAGAMKFLAEIMVERESLDQLDREERGIEDEVKLEEGERVRCGREREREREEVGGKAAEKKERISPSSTFRQRRPIRPGRIPHWARPVDQITSLYHYHYYC